MTQTNSTIILRMNVCVQNKDEILSFYKHILEKYGCERIEVNLNRMIKYHDKDKFEMLTQSEYAKIIFKLKLLMEEITGRDNLSSAIKNTCNFISNSSYSISTDGFCNYCSGLVNNGEILFKNIDVCNRKKVKFRKECRNCKSLPLCFGGCLIQFELGVGCCTYEKYLIDDILIHFIEKK